MSIRSKSLACFSLCAVLFPSTSHAQRTGEEWMASHQRDALAQAGSPRGAIALVRLANLDDHVDPTALIDRLHSASVNPAVPAARRVLATWLEAEGRRQIGQIHESVALSESLGFITRWLVIGPFDNEGRAGFNRTLTPEVERRAPPDLSRRYDGKERPVQWRTLPDYSRLGYVPLDPAVRPSVNACAFVHTTVRAPRDEPAVFWLGATGSVALFVNNTRIYADETVRRAYVDRAGVPIRLRRGENRVMLKVCSDDRGMGFYARISRLDGSPRTDLMVNPDPAVAPSVEPGDAPANVVVQGVLQALRAAAGDRAPAQAHEDLARYLALTGADDPAQPIAADRAERAARESPTAARWLLVADLQTDRNRRMEALQRAYALAPSDPQVLTAMGHERRVGVYPEECVPFLEAAMRADPTFVFAKLEYALFLESSGLALAARALIEEVARIAPFSASVAQARLFMAEHSGQANEVTGLRRNVLRLRYTDVPVHEALAREARARGDREAVRQEVERMLLLRPDNLGVYAAAAELQEAVGDGELAVGTLARASEIAPDDAALWSARGALEARLQRRDDARVSMRRALALRPQDAALRQHLEALEPPVPRADEALAEDRETFLARRQSAPAGVGTSDYHVRSLQELVVRTVYPNGLSGMFRQVVYQVRDEVGARNGRTYPMQYDPEAQRFELRSARVHHADGSMDESLQVDEYSVTSDGSARMFFSNRVAQVSFPRLIPGDTVEIRWRVDDVSARNAFSDYFGDLQIVQDAMPRAHYNYVLRAPRARELFFRVPTTPALTRTERDEGDTRVYSFAGSDVPAIPPEEHAPGVTERAGYIHVSTYRTWEDVGRWYWGLVRDQLVADDRIRTTVRTLTANLTNPRDKVRAIYNWVIGNTRYVALEFGIHGFQPYPVPQICTRGFGDCKDKASVIVTMLREAGVDADLVLLRTRPNGAIDTTPASLAIFDHAIAYVPSLDLYLDGTAQNSGMDELPGGDQGVTVLLVDQRGVAHLATTPVYTPDRNVSTVRGEVTLTAAGGATLHVSQEIRGPGAGGVRSTLEAEGTRAERIEDNLREHYPGLEVTAVHTGNLSNVEEPARFDYDARVPVYGTRQGATWLIRPMAEMNLSRQYAARSTRQFDLIIGVPSTLDETRTVRLTPGATASDLPPPTRVESPFGRFEYTVEQRGATLVAHRALVWSTDRVAAANYAEFRAFCRAVDDSLDRRVTVHMPGTEEGAR